MNINNVPRKWDVVSNVVFLNNNTRARIEFNTGMSITVKIDDSINESTRPAKSAVKVSKVVKKKPAKPVEESYRQQAINALKEMPGGYDPKMIMQPAQIDPNFELLKQQALAESLRKSEQLASELTPRMPANMAVNEQVIDKPYFEVQK